MQKKMKRFRKSVFLGKVLKSGSNVLCEHKWDFETGGSWVICKRCYEVRDSPLFKVYPNTPLTKKVTENGM